MKWKSRWIDYIQGKQVFAFLPVLCNDCWCRVWLSKYIAIKYLSVSRKWTKYASCLECYAKRELAGNDGGATSV